MNNLFKKHFVFDLDDTLVDGRTFCGECMARVITKYEPNIKFEDIVILHDQIRGGTIVDLYKTAVEKFKLKTDIETLLYDDSAIQLNEFTKIKIFTGVIEILEFIKNQGNYIHICTNRKSESLIPILKENKIDKYFDDIISCIDVGHKKPESKCLDDIIEKYGGNKEEFIYFGDSEVDTHFAKNAGIEFIIFDQYMNDKTLFKKLINMFLEKKLNGNN